jgi:transposase
MANVLVMSQKERDFLAAIKELARGRLSASDVAERLDVSRRHVFRLLHRYRAAGDAGLVHRLRWHPSNHGYPRRLRERVIELYWHQYRDYGPTLFAERLAEDHKISVDHETVRRWLMAAGGTNVQRKKRPHRTRRERRSALGDLVQFDGSEHDWFEGRGPLCTLLQLIDDASSRVFLRFVPSENTADCMRTFWDYLTRYGIPRSLYCDRGSVFFAEGGRLTDFGRALETLGVQMIYANSPQARGRVERGNRTHQDRLVKALRQRHVTTIADANRFLENTYLEHHNSRFAHPKGLPDVHRPIPKDLDLKDILCFQTTRYLNHDYTITLNARIIQILTGPYVLPRPTQSVIVRRYLDDSLHIFYADEELRFVLLDHKPQPKPHHPPIPHDNHPWRIAPLIGKAKRRRRR